MAEFKFQIEQASSAADGIHTLENDMRSYPDQLTSAVSALKQNQAASFSPVYRRLRSLNVDVLDQAAKMDTLEQALRYIIAEYTNAEKQNMGLLDAGTWAGNWTNSGDTLDENEKNIFQRFLEWIKKIFNWTEQPEEDPLAITRQQEKEHDLYMQNEIFALLDTPEYNKSTWNKATVDERKEILNRYLADLAKIYGVTVSSKVNFYKTSASTRGTYSHSRREVSINENYLTRTDSYQIMQTMIHEMRHAYQHSAVDDPDSYEVSAETIQQWKSNFSNYKSTSDGKTTYSEYGQCA